MTLFGGPPLDSPETTIARLVLTPSELPLIVWSNGYHERWHNDRPPPTGARWSEVERKPA